MSKYRAVLRLRPAAAHFLMGYRSLDSNAVSDLLEEVVAHQIATDQWGVVSLDATLSRRDAEGTLNDLLMFAQQLGYSLIAGELEKLASREVESALMVGLGGGTLGATSNNGWAALLFAIAGSAVGWLVGRSLQYVEILYEVRPNPYGGWVFSPKPQPQADSVLRLA